MNWAKKARYPDNPVVEAGVSHKIHTGGRVGDVLSKLDNKLMADSLLVAPYNRP